MDLREQIIEAIFAKIASDKLFPGDLGRNLAVELADAVLAVVEPALAAERERCAAFVHELWHYGIPAQELAQRIRELPPSADD